MGWGILLLILLIMAYFTTKKDKKRTIIRKCSNCGWVGTEGRWKEVSGCPSCRSDLYTRHYQ